MHIMSSTTNPIIQINMMMYKSDVLCGHGGCGIVFIVSKLGHCGCSFLQLNPAVFMDHGFLALHNVQITPRKILIITERLE